MNFLYRITPIFFLIPFIILSVNSPAQIKTQNQRTRSPISSLKNMKMSVQANYNLNDKWTSGKKTFSTAAALFSEDFDGIPGPTAGGAGTYVFPSGWNLVNVDNRTPAGSVSYVNDAWERREDFANNVTDSAAFSTSWYSPIGASDDWMISPPITIGENARLTWNAVTYDASYRDGYEVRISTTTQTVSGCLANPPLFSIAEENSVWTGRSINLDSAGYSNQTIYLAWRNISSDKFLLLIDDIAVENIIQYDAQVTSVLQSSEYTMLPQWQMNPIQIGALVSNNGSNDITNVQVQADVYQNGTLVYSDVSGSIAAINPGSSSQINLIPYFPSDTGLIEINYKALITENDQDTSNNYAVSSPVYISQNELARDDGQPVGSLGIGAGNGGEMGAHYLMNTAGNISSIKVYLTKNYPVEPLFARIRNFDNGKPGDSIIAVTDTFYAPNDSARWISLNIHGGPVFVAADTFVVTINEEDSTLSLGHTLTLFTPGTIWVNWPTNPMGDWANVEAFGVGFSKPFMIRPILEPVITPAPFIVVDGIQDSFYTTLTGPDEGYLQIRSFAFNDNGVPVNDADLSAKVWAVWDSVWFYLYEEVRDDTISANYGATWGVDQLELKFDPQPTDSVNNSIWDVRFTALGMGNPDVLTADSLSNVSDSLKLWARTIIPGGYALELGIKWTAIGHNIPEVNESIVPAVDSIFGFAINQHDNDARTPPRRQASIMWASVLLDAVFETPKYCGTVKFLPGHKLQFIPVNNMTGKSNEIPYDGSDYTLLSTENGKLIPAEFSLMQNYPNPFNPTSKIRFAVPNFSMVNLKVYDILGNVVAELVNETMSAGNYEVEFNAAGLSSGIYFYQMKAGSFIQTKKMILIK
ncbi:MAG: choice-of-anchor J domain-containing protein [Ignavibacteria bacterium]